MMIDLYTRISLDLLLNGQGKRPKTSHYQKQETKQYLNRDVMNNEMLKLRSIDISRVDDSHQELAIHCQNDSSKSKDDSPKLFLGNLRMIDEIIYEKREDDTTDIQYVENRYRDDIMHKNVGDLLDKDDPRSYH